MKKNIKSVSAALLSLCMLCGLLFSVTVLPTAATAEDEVALPEAFEADFADLAVQVDPTVFVDGVYTPTAADDGVNHWVNTHFDIYATLQSGTPRERAYAGQCSFALESDKTWGGDHHWVIDQNGYFIHSVSKQGGELFRKGEQMVLKTADGAQAQVKNFEATVVFNTKGNGRGAVVLSFHEQEAGHFVNNQLSAKTDAVVIGRNSDTDNDWVLVRKIGSDHSKKDMSNKYFVDGKTTYNADLVKSEQLSANLANNTDYTLYVKVLGETATVKLSNASGVILSKDFPVTAENGTISVGATNATRAFKSIVVRELDAEGNYVPFGTATTNVSTFTEKFNNLWEFSGGVYVDSVTGVDRNDQFYFNTTWDDANPKAVTEITQVLNMKFNEYLDFYGNYYAPNFKKLASTAYAGENAGFWELLSNATLQRVGTTYHNRNMRAISSLVPKSERTGEELRMTNMETSFGIYWDTVNATITSKDQVNNDAAPGSVIFGFRQQKAGAFTVADKTLRQDTAFVVISRTGFTVMGGAECAGNNTHPGLFNAEADEYSFFDYADSGYKTMANSIFNVKIRAVGNDLKLYVYATWNETVDGETVGKSALLFNNFAGGAQENVVIDVGGYVEEGTVAFSIGEKKAGLRDISLTRLDDNGNPINLDADPTAFEVDFSELAQIAYADGTYDANGLYVSKYDDKAINDWTNTRFDIYHTNQNSDTVERLYLGQSSYAFYNNTSDKDAWGGAHNWLIDRTGYLRYNVTHRGDQQLRKGEQLVLKTASGAQAQMENFEATVVFNTLADDRGGVVVSFHEPVAGKFAEANGATAATSAVIVGNAGDASSNDGVIVRQSGAAANYNGLNNTTAVRALKVNLTKNLNANTDYKLFVRVLNKKVTVRVTSADGATVHYAGEATLTASYNGTVSVGVVNANRAIKSIKVKEMDADGAYVDFGTATTNVKDFKYSFNNVIQVTTGDVTKTQYPNGNAYFNVKDEASNYPEVVAEMQYNLRQRFDEYMNAEKNWTKTDFAVVEGAGTNSGTDNGKDNGGFWQLWEGWIQRKTKGVTWKQNMRLVSSMVPKDEITGEPYKMTNFETSFTARFEGAMGVHGNIANSEHTQSTIVLGFRQGETGHYAVAENWVRSDQAYLAITQSGITVAGGDNIPKYNTEAADKATHQALYNGDATYSFADFYTPVNNAKFNVRARVVGNEMKLYVHSSWTVKENGTDVPKEAELFNNFEGGKDEQVVLALGNRICEGAVAYGIGEYEGSINNISLTRLDDNGNPTDIDAEDDGTATVTNYKAGDGKQMIMVEPAEGFELKAGSLKAIDANGNVYVPTRVGFREDETISDRYEVPTDNPVVLVYEFITPTLKAPNVGNIGNSFNENLNGLRFVSRFTHVGNTVVLDGKTYTLKDYGMLVTSEPGIEANKNMTAEQALSLNEALKPVGNYVQKLSILTENKFYDVCDAHTDMAVTLINIDKVQGYPDPLAIEFYARPYVVVEVNGTDTVLYGKYFSASYADVAPASAE